MAKPSRLQVEIDSVERDINVLAQVKAHLDSGKSPAAIADEIGVLTRVSERLRAALPPAPSASAPVVKRTRKAKKAEA